MFFFLIVLYSGLFQKNENKFQITKDLIETIRDASYKTNRFAINSIINIVLGLIQLVSVILKKELMIFSMTFTSIITRARGFKSGYLTRYL